MSKQSSRVNRRAFLTRAAGWAAVPWVVPSSVFGADGTKAPSNRIALGFIGIGMMGQGHVHLCTQYPEAQVLALCDVDRWRRDNAKTVVEEQYAARRTSGTYRGCQTHVDLREVIGREDVDAVVVATGDRWHAAATIMAAKAGKDVYTEKPVSLTIAEARAMIDTVRRYGRVFQGGLQQRSTPEFRKACALVRAGALGKVKIVYVIFSGTSGDVSLPAEPVPDGLDWDLWLGPAPARPYNKAFHPYGRPHGVVPWHFCRDFGGGNLTSNAVHAFDVVQWGLDMDKSGPVEITPPETGKVPVLTYRYANGVLLQVVDGRLDRNKQEIPKGWDEKTPIQAFGAVFVGEKGWIHVGRSGFLQSFPAEIVRDARATLGPDRPVNNHHQNWFDCIRSRQDPACDVEKGCRSTMVSHLGCIAHWTGRALKWDPAKEEFLGDEGANKMRDRPHRAPWGIE